MRLCSPVKSACPSASPPSVINFNQASDPHTASPTVLLPPQAAAAKAGLRRCISVGIVFYASSLPPFLLLEIRTSCPVCIRRISATFRNAYLSLIFWVPTYFGEIRIQKFLASHNSRHIRSPVFRFTFITWSIMPDAFWNILFLAVKIHCHRVTSEFLT